MCALTQQSQQQPRDTYFYLDFTMASRRLKYEGASYWLLKYSLVALLLQVSHSLSSPEGECYRNGATFVGLSLSRWSNSGNQDTVTRQVQFDFCEVYTKFAFILFIFQDYRPQRNLCSKFERRRLACLWWTELQ